MSVYMDPSGKSFKELLLDPFLLKIIKSAKFNSKAKRKAATLKYK